MADNTGKNVKVHYIGTLDDGTEFDSSVKRGEPLGFTCMAGQMIPGFDKAVASMEEGQTQTVRIPAAEAYGEHDPNAVQALPAGQQVMAMIDVADLPVGKTVYLQGPGGQPMPVKVVEAGPEGARVDMNHELAGKDLTFEITLVEVSD